MGNGMKLLTLDLFGGYNQEKHSCLGDKKYKYPTEIPPQGRCLKVPAKKKTHPQGRKARQSLPHPEGGGRALLRIGLLSTPDSVLVLCAMFWAPVHLSLFWEGTDPHLAPPPLPCRDGKHGRGHRGIRRAARRVVGPLGGGPGSRGSSRLDPVHHFGRGGGLIGASSRPPPFGYLKPLSTQARVIFRGQITFPTQQKVSLTPPFGRLFEAWHR